MCLIWKYVSLIMTLEEVHFVSNLIKLPWHKWKNNMKVIIIFGGLNRMKLLVFIVVPFFGNCNSNQHVKHFTTFRKDFYWDTFLLPQLSIGSPNIKCFEEYSHALFILFMTLSGMEYLNEILILTNHVHVVRSMLQWNQVQRLFLNLCFSANLLIG